MEPIRLEAEADKKDIRYVVHVSDIHIRTGDLEKCRYEEYSGVFRRFVEDVSTLENLKESVLVITGDIFHNKGKIEPAGIKLAQSLLISLLEYTDVFMICGNHDYRQDNPSIPDMIESIYENYITQNVHTKYRAFYLNKTGYYLYNNVCFTVVHIKDTLKDYNTYGKNENILAFPPKLDLPNVDYTIALFHGSVLPCRLMNNLNITNSYDFEWFGNHDYIMLGDNHRMQWSMADGEKLWAYSGSLIQQDFGEHFMEHGYLIWNLKNKTISSRIVFNDYGFCTVKRATASSGQVGLMVHIKQREWRVIDTFPQHVSFRTLFKEDVSHVKNFCSMKGLEPACILYWAGATSVSVGVGANDADYHASGGQHIEELNTTDKWFEYLGKHTDINKIKHFILHPELLKLPQLDEGTEFLKKHIVRNDKIQKVINEYVCETTKINKTTQRTQLVRMQWAYLMCYGETNYFDFDCLQGTIALLNGKNAMGKSSFLDVLCIALYGEPTKMRNIVNGRRYTDKIIHDQRPINKSAPSVRLTFRVGNETYEIYRTFGTQAAKNKEHMIMQTCVHVYKYDSSCSQKTLLCEGSTLVDKWIGEHIGSMDTVLMSTMICQTDLNNFFHLKQDDQKNILDKALRLETVSLYGKVLKESILAHSDIVQQIKTAKQTMEAISPKDQTEEKNSIEAKLVELDARIKEKKEWKSVIQGHSTRIVKERDIPNTIEIMFNEAETRYLAIPPSTDSSAELAIVYREKVDAIKDEIEEYKDTLIVENDEALYNKWKVKYEDFLGKKPQWESSSSSSSKCAQYKFNREDVLGERPPLSVTEYEELLMHFTKVSRPSFPEISVSTTLEEYENSAIEHSRLLSNPVVKNRTQEEYDEWYTTNVEVRCDDIVKTRKRLKLYQDKVKKAQIPRDTDGFVFNTECSACIKNQKCCEGTKVALLAKWKGIVEECLSYEKYLTEKAYWDGVLAKWKEYDEWKEAIDYHSRIIREYEQCREWTLYNEREREHAQLIENYQLAKLYLEKDEWDKHSSAREMYEIWSKEEQVVLGRLKTYNDSMKKRELNKVYANYYAEYVKHRDSEDARQNYETCKDMYYSKKLHTVDRELDTFNNEYSELIVEKAKIESCIDAYIEHMRSYQKICNLEKLYEDRLTRIKELELLFIGDKVNSDGYKEWIYKTQVVPLINNEMNAFLGMFENFTFDMSYTKKNFIYMIEDRGNKPTLDKASGYQNFIICLAFRIILARIGAVGQQLKHLFIDEGFTACDSVNIEKVPQLLKSTLTYGEYASILLMSHLDSVRECTSIHINIDRADPFSYIHFPKNI